MHRICDHWEQVSGGEIPPELAVDIIVEGYLKVAYEPFICRRCHYVACYLRATRPACVTCRLRGDSGNLVSISELRRYY